MASKGTMIQFGKVVVAGDVSMAELKETLFEVLERCGYPEGESPKEIDVRKALEEDLQKKEQELEEDFKKLGEGDRSVLEEKDEERRVPWERGR